MIAEVLSFGSAKADDNRKRAFLDAVAISYDRYVEDQGEEPQAIAYVMGGLKQSAQPGYMMQGDSCGGSTTFLAFAALALQHEALSPDD